MKNRKSKVSPVKRIFSRIHSEKRFELTQSSKFASDQIEYCVSEAGRGRPSIDVSTSGSRDELKWRVQRAASRGKVKRKAKQRAENRPLYAGHRFFSSGSANVLGRHPSLWTIDFLSFFFFFFFETVKDLSLPARFGFFANASYTLD